MTEKTYDIAVVGAGAVGLSAALAFARDGYRTVLIGALDIRRDGRTVAPPRAPPYSSFLRRPCTDLARVQRRRGPFAAHLTVELAAEADQLEVLWIEASEIRSIHAPVRTM